MIMCSLFVDSLILMLISGSRRSFIDPGVVLRCCVSPGRCDGFIGC